MPWLRLSAVKPWPAGDPVVRKCSSTISCLVSSRRPASAVTIRTDGLSASDASRSA